MKKVGEFKQVIPIFIAFIIICAIISVLSPIFLTVSNLKNVILQASINAVLAVGLTFVIITSGIDLSVGSILAFSGMVLGFALHWNVPLLPALLIGLLAGAVFGFINGSLIVRWALPPFITTLGTMSIARGLALVLNNGKPVSGFEGSFRFIAEGQIAGVPVFILIVVVVYSLSYIILNKTSFGRYIYATGGNPEAAHLSGVDTKKVLLWVYIISGFLAGLGAIMLTSRIDSAQPTAGTMFELDAIAAAVIGGTSLRGGYGLISGTLVGALIISVIRNGLNLLDVSSFIQQIVIGVVIIMAVLIDHLKYGSDFNAGAYLKNLFKGVKRIIPLIVVCLVILAIILGMVFFGITNRSRAMIPKIGFIMKTLNNPFFIEMADEAQKEIKKYPGYGLIIQAPDIEVDVEKQVRYMENMITGKVKVICITPSGSKEVLSGVIEANKAGIPIIVVDTRLDKELVKQRGAKYATFIGSDNYEGGKVAARFVAKNLGGQGSVALLEGIAGALTGDLRKQGFMDALKDYPGLRLVASQTANMERGRGFDVTQNILQAHPDVQAIFACNDLMALGAVEAVNQAGSTGKIIIVGFDATEDARKAIMEGKMTGSIAQYPSAMGEAAVECAIKLIKGKEIPREILTKIEMITKEMLEKEAKTVK